MSLSREKVWRIGEFALHCSTVVLLLTTVMLIEQDVELGQLHQTVGQLREENEKALGRAEKLSKELKGE